MGKKQGKASSKVSKDVNEKKQLNNWIKFLRPKVYITDSSSFKRLVQDLTGNGSTTAISELQTVENSTSSSSNGTSEEYNYHRAPESSLETSLDSSFESHVQNQVSFPEEEEEEEDHQIINQTCNQLLYLDDTCTSSENHLFWFDDQQDYYYDLQACQAFETFYGCNYSQILQEEVSIYDYELSELF